jgi:hypothetical protein
MSTPYVLGMARTDSTRHEISKCVGTKARMRSYTGILPKSLVPIGLECSHKTLNLGLTHKQLNRES